MKVYCLFIYDHPERTLDSVYKSWEDAYDAATLDNVWSIEVYDLETGEPIEKDGESEFWIVCGRYPKHHYSTRYSRDIDPTEDTHDN